MKSILFYIYFSVKKKKRKIFDFYLSTKIYFAIKYMLSIIIRELIMF